MGHFSAQPYFLLFLTHLEMHTYLGGSAINMMKGVTLHEPYIFFLSKVFANLSVSLVNAEASKVGTAESLDAGQAVFRPSALNTGASFPSPSCWTGIFHNPRPGGRVPSVVQRVPSSRGRCREKVGPNTLTISQFRQALACLLSTLTTFLPLHP